MPHVIQRIVIYWRRTVNYSILQDILLQIFDITQSDMGLQKQVH